MCHNFILEKELTIMITPLTKEQEEILNDYLKSGLSCYQYAKEHNMKYYQVTYIHQKYLRLKELSSKDNIKIGKVVLNTRNDSNYDSLIKIKINDIDLEIKENLNEDILSKIIKGCVYATRSI